MAKQKHLDILSEGATRWNKWIEKDFRARVDLSGANLVYRTLNGINLWNADLDYAILSQATLLRAQLIGTSLRSAILHRTNLREALLVGTYFIRTDLTRAQLAQATLRSAVFASVDLSQTEELSKVIHLGPSAIDVDTLERTALGLIKDSSRQDEIERFYRDAGIPQHTINFYRPGGTKEFERHSSCFISYSHANESFALRLYNQLRTRGIVCWLDKYDLDPGDPLLDSVDEAIRSFDRILLCCSKESLDKSWWVKDEIDKALELERKEKRNIIIPLNLDGYLLEGWKNGQASTLRARLAADFTGWEQDNAKFEREFERVVKALRTDEGAREPTPNARNEAVESDHD